jgi:hypothetical protein
MVARIVGIIAVLLLLGSGLVGRQLTAEHPEAATVAVLAPAVSGAN